MKTIHVICAVDNHIPYIKFILERIRSIFPDDDYAVASFVNIKNPNTKLGKFCQQNNIAFYESVQDFDIPKLPYCEICGIMDISNYFYNLNYDEVFLLHNDVVILEDYKNDLRNKMNNSWSVICPFMDYRFNNNNLNNLWKLNKHLNSHYFERNTTLRLTLSLVIFNKTFLNQIIKDFGSIKNFYLEKMFNSSPYGDCALFDLNFYGLTPNPICDNNFLLEGCWNQSTDQIINESSMGYKYIHLGAIYNKNENLYSL